MELKKTTILSALVCIAGLLSEIIFHETLTDSIFGVVLSIILGLLVIGSAYFVFDGIYCMMENIQILSGEHQMDYEKQMYSALNEQLKVQKAAYEEICELAKAQKLQMEVLEQISKMQQTQEKQLEHVGEVHKMQLEQMEKMSSVEQAQTEQLEKSDRIHQSQMEWQESAEKMQQTLSDLRQEIQGLQEVAEKNSAAMPDGAFDADRMTQTMPEEALDKLVNSINENTLKAAKLIVKYISKNTNELKTQISATDGEIPALCEKLQDTQRMLQETMNHMQRNGDGVSAKLNASKMSALDLLELEEAPTVETVDAMEKRSKLNSIE